MRWRLTNIYSLLESLKRIKKEVKNMNGIPTKTMLLLGTLLIVSAFAMASSEGASDKDILNAKKTTATITIDGDASEAAWDTAQPLIFSTVRGIGKTRNVMMKALYDNSNIYLLAVWQDQSGTESDRINSWVYDAGTSTFSLFPNINPDILDQAAEDRLGMQWEIGEVEGFSQRGCRTLCHRLNSKKPGMRTNNPGEKTDEWHWKAGRSNPVGIAHDKYIDDTYDPNDIEAGHHGDSSGWYSRNRNAAKTGPKYFEPNPTDAVDAKFLLQSEIDSNDAILVAGNETLLTDGQVIPGRILDESKVVGDVADIKAKGVFSNGIWTLEMKRALNTGSANDVVFDPAKTNDFGVSIFDDSGATPQHSYSVRPKTLIFSP